MSLQKIRVAKEIAKQKIYLLSKEGKKEKNEEKITKKYQKKYQKQFAKCFDKICKSKTLAQIGVAAMNNPRNNYLYNNIDIDLIKSLSADTSKININVNIHNDNAEFIICHNALENESYMWLDLAKNPSIHGDSPSATPSTQPPSPSILLNDSYIAMNSSDSESNDDLYICINSSSSSPK